MMPISSPSLNTAIPTPITTTSRQDKGWAKNQRKIRRGKERKTKDRNSDSYDHIAEHYLKQGDSLVDS